MKLSIKTKLIIGFGAALLLLVSMVSFLILKLSESNDRLGHIVSLSSRKVSLSQEILINVLEAARYEKNIILENDPAIMNKHESKLLSALSSVDRCTNELQELIDADGQNILNVFKASWSAYKPKIEEIISLALKNQDERAFAISTNEGYKTRENAISTLFTLVEKNEKGMAEDKITNDRNYSSSVSLIIVLVLASLFISIILSYWIIEGITKRISFISSEAQKIAGRENTGEKMIDPIVDELSSIYHSLETVNLSFREITESANSVASGNYSYDFVPRSEKDVLGNSLKKMTVSLRETTAENKKHNWLTTGQNLLNERLRGDQTLEALSDNIMTFLCSYLESNVGAMYLLDQDDTLRLFGRYSIHSSETINEYKLGEGLIGQVAAQKKPLYLTNLEDDHLRIMSALVNTRPNHVCIIPFLFEGKVLGVIELGHLKEFSSTVMEFLTTCMESIAISVNSALDRNRIQQLLEETQAQSEELQSQQEELKQINEELEEQTQSMRQQQEELQMTNEELEEQTQTLETKNREVEQARSDIEEKTKQLEISSKYKSQFLANMSHELRTPLNSLLILSKDLADNKSRNLTADQVESAEIINKSGYDLLSLINEVLDLSKIEAGKMILNLERKDIRELLVELQRDFKHQAEDKGLSLDVEISPSVPEFIVTDSQRLNQILRNLLSNALKFTHKGKITLRAQKDSDDKIAISVADTGIGIPEEKQLAIFEAFQQADGGTSRKYGGTGLGLSISRELAKLLNGRIKLHSNVDQGSVFTLIIPIEATVEVKQIHTYEKSSNSLKASQKNEEAFLNYSTIEDDRNNISAADKVVLIIEDDLNFATVLRNLARNKKFKVLAASTGEDGLLLCEKYKPNAIILDMELPGINGRQVLAELKADPAVRHIPVHIISISERSLETIKEGAVEFLTKPVNKKQIEEAFARIEYFIDRKMKNLLIVEDDDNSRKAIKKLIGDNDVHTYEASNGTEALELFRNNHIDCIVLDLGLPDMTGFVLINKLSEVKDNLPPIIVYTGKELSREENQELQKYAESIIIKGAKSEERLLDETALFLHRAIDSLPKSKRQIITTMYDKEHLFNGKKILLVDDDMRNVFALAKILKEKGMEIIKADNGKVALSELDKNFPVDLVLMDIMMPEMDGYEAMKKIREQARFKALPVIALTAKAMKEDKQKCIDAGANDYITKPVDVERLLSLMRVWLSK